MTVVPVRSHYPEAMGTKIVTFYSFKGGAGRTMALANVAWILASAGKRVLTVDWDLESPGLHRFFRPFLKDRNLTSNTGVIDLLRDYAAEASIYDPSDPRLIELRRGRASVEDHVQTLTWDFPDGGRIDFLGPGTLDDTYDFSIGSFPWQWLLDRADGKAFIAAVRDSLKGGSYDYVLVDSRTGVPDIVVVCTEMLPDMVVFCLAMHNQSVEGGAKVAARIAERAQREIRLVPILTRYETEDRNRRARRLANTRRYFAEPLAKLVGDSSEMQLRFLASMAIPYRPYYSYEEVLATFADQLGGPQALLGAYQLLTGVVSDNTVTSMIQMPLNVSEKVVRDFELLSTGTPNRVLLWAAPQDRAWAEWIRQTFTDVGIAVADVDTSPDAPTSYADGDALVVVVSPHLANNRTLDAIAWDWVGRHGSGVDSDDQSLTGVRVAAGPVPEPYSAIVRLSLHSQDAATSRAALLDRFGLTAMPSGDGSAGHRYPLDTPDVWNVGGQDMWFVGRSQELAQMRSSLTRGGVTGGRCAVMGASGLGKTSLAQEFAHRFASEYELVWWLDASSADSVWRGLAELGSELEVAESSGRRDDDRDVRRIARSALDHLRRGQPHERWLLIFDGAGDPAELLSERLIPDSGPLRHVIVTSVRPDWEESASTLALDRLLREDSLQYLGRRLPGAVPSDLGMVADQVNDNPLALVGAVGSIKGDPAELPLAIRKFCETAAAQTPLPNFENVAAWSVTYARLRNSGEPAERAAARLVELLAYLSPQGVSTRLFGSSAMLRASGVSPDEVDSDRPAWAQVLGVVRLNALVDGNLDAPVGEVWMHQLVQEQVRGQLLAEQRDVEVQVAVNTVLAAYAPPAEDYFEASQFPVYEELQRHIHSAQAPRSTDHKVRRWLLYQLFYLNRTGQRERALALGEECLKRWRATLGVDDPLTLRLASHLANTYRSMTRFRDAFDLDDDTIVRQRREIGPFHPHTLFTGIGLGADKRSLGWFRDAYGEDQATWDAYRRKYGDENIYTLDAATGLSLSLYLVGDLPEALDLCRAVLAQREVLLKPDDPMTAWTRTRVAICLRDLDQFDEALSLLQTAAESLRKAEGERSHYGLRTRKHQAVTLRRMGDLELAAELTAETLEKFQEFYGAQDPGTIACQLAAAAADFSLGKIPSAARLAEECLTWYRAKYGRTHPFAMACATDLSVYELADGRQPDAAAHAEEAFDQLVEQLYPYHPFAIAGAVNWANVLVARGLASNAAAVEAAAAAAGREYLGPDHPYTRIAGANLADTRGRVDGGPGGSRAHIEIDISTI